MPSDSVVPNLEGEGGALVSKFLFPSCPWSGSARGHEPFEYFFWRI